MRFSAITAVVLSVVSAVVASPIAGEEKSNSTLIERGNGSEIIYLVTCNGEAHANRAAYYSNWQDSQTYGAHAPNSISASNNGFTGVTAPNWVWYYFSDTGFRVRVENYDPGWYNVAGVAASSFGVEFTCRMDNGRQLYNDCFSNYYCQ
ncbi:hypothetical protein CPB83DRAFT_59387 [Crepidotus variabilis]|uniref:Uncharacterized protein n=1 Tax=Crepidotus variabilis TaxID=179855 RepID=A0A9P6JJM8_9AGAR|nr:hypothetical protein CPB83DRAFT_59387 [Crepidotus variabilis]